MAAAQYNSYRALQAGYREAAEGIGKLWEDAVRVGPATHAELLATLDTSVGQQQSATYLAGAFDSLNTFEALNKAFKGRRDEVAREINTFTESLVTDPGLAYNYVEQARHLQLRFTRDFRDAYIRMLVAQDGLKTIYAFDILGFPAITAAMLPDAPVFDDAVTWVRDAIRSLVGFGQLDQSYVLSISLRQSMKEAAWKAAIEVAGVTDPIRFTFLFDEGTCANQRHVRLRGVGACVLSRFASPWRLTIRAPEDSFFRYLSDKKTPVVQHDVPSVRLGRVLNRLPQRDPDVSGVVSLRNVSPLFVSG